MNGASDRRRRFLLAGCQAAAAMTLLTWLPSLRAHQRLSQPDATPAVVGLVYDAANQVLYKATEQTIDRSADGGHIWSRVELPKLPDAVTLASIAVATLGPTSKAALYVATSGAGVLRSDDDGRTWVERNNGLPGTSVTALTTHADRPATVFIYMKGHGILRSEDGGRRWRLMDAGPRDGVTAFIHSNMPGSMQSGWLFAGGATGVSRAMDGFGGWTDAGELGRAARAIAFDPRRPSDIFAAATSALVVSRDGGETWSEIAAPGPTIAALTVTPRGEIYAAGHDGGLYLRADSAAPWKRLDA